MPEKFINEDRLRELWAAIKAIITTAIADAKFTTVDEVATAIAAALAGYPNNEAMQAAITSALASYLTADETNAAIATAVADAAHIRFELVDVLPEEGEANVIYLVPSGGTGSSAKNEYIWINGAWELLGSTDIDLSDYWAKSDLQVMTSAELQAILV